VAAFSHHLRFARASTRARALVRARIARSRAHSALARTRGGSYTPPPKSAA
jgi:hypothetical protein